MVPCPLFAMLSFFHLSVLALSSRFDGPLPAAAEIPLPCLSVLALSSRFDGQQK